MSQPSKASFDDRTEAAVGVDTRHMMASLQARLFGGSTHMKLGRYELSDRVGAGAMGAVFRARDPKLSRTVAIKVISASALGTDREDYVARLLTEAQALASLSHPNVVAVHDVGEQDGQVFIAMEYVAGVTLRQWMHDRAPREPVARLRAGLPLFEQAGRGLAAAHALGLVHRDFKPDNVLVGDDGRVRVVDFGLAAGHALGVDPGTESDATQQTLPGSVSGTRTGQLLGTPAYMAPEQFRGSQVGPAADQWAFCIALYELCFGARPFGGRTVQSLATAVMEEPLEIPDGSGVPAPLRGLLRRGLERPPDKRFPDMDALLAELHRLRAGPRRRIAIALVVGGGALGAAATWAAAPTTDETQCTESTKELDPVWNDEARTSLRSALEASSRAYAQRSADTLVDAIDDYAERWREARVQACEDARAALGESESLSDRKVACLARSLREVEARIDVWTSGGDTVVDQAPVLARDLPGVQQCESADQLVTLMPPPDDPDARELYDRVDAAVPRARALATAARFDEALGLLEPLRAEVEASTDAATAARFWEARSLLALKVGDMDTFRRASKAALLAAVRVGDDRAAAGASVQLGNSEILRRRASEARDWAELAIGYAERAGTRSIEAEARRVLALSLANLGHTEQSAAEFERALALTEEANVPAARIRLRSERAALFVQLGELPRAAEVYRDAMVETAALFGEDHPDVAHERLNMATALLMMGRLDEAQREFETGIERWRSVYGPDYPKLSAHLGNLAGLYTRRGETEKALEIAQEVLRVAKVHGGDDSPETVSARRLVSGLLADLGRDDEAREQLRAMLSAAHRAFADDPGALATSLLSAAHTHARFEEYPQAIAYAAQADAEQLRLTDPPKVQRWQLLNLRAYLEIQNGTPQGAIEPARRAIEIAIQGKFDPARVGHTRVNLATALFEAGERAAAEETVRLAIETLEETGDFSPGDLANGRKLLAKLEAEPD